MTFDVSFDIAVHSDIFASLRDQVKDIDYHSIVTFVLSRI